MARKKKAPAKPKLRRVSNLPGEEWALVKGTEDYYVSNLGRFKRITHKGDSLRSKIKDLEGYIRVNIGHRKYRLHRLVAEAFVPNPNNYPVIDHLDGNKENNVASNLEWVTQQMNTQRAYENGLIKNTGQQLWAMALDADDNAILFDTQAELSRQLNLYSKSVHAVASGKQPTTKGYRVFRIRTLDDRRTGKKVRECKKDIKPE